MLDAYPEWRIPTHVITTVPTADRQKATVRVRIGFEPSTLPQAQGRPEPGRGTSGSGASRTQSRGEQLDPRILPDMGVKVSFLTERPAAESAAPRAKLVVPSAALRTADGRSIVFVVRDDRVERRAISVVPPVGDQVEVLVRCQRRRTRRGRGSTDAQRWRQGEGAMMSNDLVAVRDLHKVFSAADNASTCCRVSIWIFPQGDFLALMGPSGSGKTTLLNLLGGLDTPTEGSISVAGDRLDKMSGAKLSAWRARHIGFVFQLYNLLPVLTAARNVELPLLLTKLGKADRRKRVEVALSVVGLGDRMNHYPRQLSGGQEQRVGIARAIVTDPTLLLCDEPTGDLDRKSGDEILDLLQALNREHGKTIVMVTHDPHAAARAKRTLHLDKGVLVTEAAA